MITKHCLTQEWINEVSANYNNADKVLVEKVIRALLLLEGLAESKLPFVFKGGTALMILLNSSKRLSIDIDIIMPDNKGLDEAVIAIANAKGFTRAVLQHRNTGYNIEKAHYQFFYTPTFKTLNHEESVLLDVLFETV
jgi:predicted nucleotidyltransferase component of viral defense system